MLFLFLPLVAKAGFVEGMIVGGMLSSGSKTKEVVIVDEFTKQVEAIEPSVRDNSYYLRTPFMEFKVNPSKAEDFVNYFSNKGYSVSHKKGVLTFDFKNSFEMQQLRLEDRRKESAAQSKWMKETWDSIKIPVIIFSVLAYLFAFFLTLKKDTMTYKLINWTFKTQKRIRTRYLEKK